MSIREEVKTGLTFTAIVAGVFITMLATVFLVMPWAMAASDAYSDWVHCQTHPYVEHSWTINTYGCTPVSSTK